MFHLNIKRKFKPFLYYTEVLCNLLSYKGSSTEGGVMCKKGQVGTRGIYMNWVRCSCICKRSLVQVFLLITKILFGVKCKWPTNITMQPSKKS
jgi:hypothetical protein